MRSEIFGPHYLFTIAFFRFLLRIIRLEKIPLGYEESVYRRNLRYTEADENAAEHGPSGQILADEQHHDVDDGYDEA